MKTIVLGSGIIGTTTAYFLAKAGHEVHVVDRQPEAGDGDELRQWRRAAYERSRAVVAARHAARRAVLDRQGERADAAPARARCRRCGDGASTSSATARSSATAKAAAVNLRLANHTLSLMPAVRADTGVEYDLMQKGTLKIYTKREALDEQRRRVGAAARMSGWSSSRSTPALRRDRAGAGADRADARRRHLSRRPTSTATATSSRSGSASTARRGSA